MGNVIVRRMIQSVNVLHVHLENTFLAMTGNFMITVPTWFVDWTKTSALPLLPSFSDKLITTFDKCDNTRFQVNSIHELPLRRIGIGTVCKVIVL